MLNFDIDYKNTYENLNSLFRKRLKEILSHRKINQTDFGVLLGGRSQSTISRWIKNDDEQNLPNSITFLAVCKILKVDPNFFMDDEMSFEMADLCNRNLSNQESFILPFINTSVSIRLFNLLRVTYENNKVIAISTCQSNGTTRALNEYQRVINCSSLIINEIKTLDEIFQKIESKFKVEDSSEFLKKNKLMIIIEISDNTLNTIISKIIDTIYSTYKLPIAIIGKNVDFSDSSYQKKIFDYYNLHALTTDDILLIIQEIYPNLPNNLRHTIKVLSRGSIRELVNHLEKISGIDIKSINKNKLIKILSK